MMVTIPRARFYTRKLYREISYRRKKYFWGRKHLIHPRIHQLVKWKSLPLEEVLGKRMVPWSATVEIRTGAAKVGWVGNLDEDYLRRRVRRNWTAQGMLNKKDI